MKPTMLVTAVAALSIGASVSMAETIYVQSLTGTTTMIEVGLGQTVAELKEIYAEEAGVPAESQRLIFAGKELEDDAALSDYNMHAESTVHLVIRLR